MMSFWAGVVLAKTIYSLDNHIYNYFPFSLSTFPSSAKIASLSIFPVTVIALAFLKASA
jgi:hypothetical protein